MYMREVIDSKIVDLQRLLASTDDPLTITLLNMAIESFESERDALLQTEHRSDGERSFSNPEKVKGADVTKPA